MSAHLFLPCNSNSSTSKDHMFKHSLIGINTLFYYISEVSFLGWRNLQNLCAKIGNGARKNIYIFKSNAATLLKLSVGLYSMFHFLF